MIQSNSGYQVLTTGVQTPQSGNLYGVFVNNTGQNLCLGVSLLTLNGYYTLDTRNVVSSGITFQQMGTFSPGMIVVLNVYLNNSLTSVDATLGPVPGVYLIPNSIISDPVNQVCLATGATPVYYA